MAHVQGTNSKLWHPESTHEKIDPQKMFIDNVLQQEANFTELRDKVNDAQNVANQVSNPNLLVNPDFRVNQRGKTSYSGVTWTADRWFSNNGKNTIELTNSGIKITMVGASYFAQNIEILPKGTYTISAEVYQAGDPLTLMVSGVSSWLVSLANVGVVSATFTIDEDKTGGVGIGIFGNTTSDVATGTSYIKWIKLERGSIATPFIAPDPWDEMLKCGVPNDNDTIYGFHKRVLEADSITGIEEPSGVTLASLFPLVRTGTVKYFFYSNGLPTDFPFEHAMVSTLANLARVTIKRSGGIAFYLIEGVYASGAPVVIEGYFRHDLQKFYWKNISEDTATVVNATVENN